MVTNNALEDKIGGHERYVRELAATLSRRGVEVSIVAKQWPTGRRARERCPDGVTLDRYRVPSKANPLYAGLYPAYAAYGVHARSPRRDADTIIHAHMGLPALPLAVTRRHYVLTFHAPVWRELLNERQQSYALPAVIQDQAVAALRRVESLVVRRAATTVVLSEFMRNELAILDKHAAARARVLPGGIDNRRFSPGRDRPADALDSGGVLFTARRLTPRTGIDELIKAMPAIAAARPDLRLKIAGTGPLEHELRALSDELGVSGAVQFLGRISDQQLVDWYRRASLVVLPTRELEGFGLATAEALACGAAVIGTPAGATPELLRPIDPALVTDDTSAKAIADRVLQLLGNRERLAQIRRRATQRVVPTMTWDRIADGYLELYERAAR